MTTVLIADDDDDVRFVLERIFQRDQFTVHVAADGIAALRLAIEIRPDGVLTDLDMPGMNGLELCRAVRAHPELGDVPVAVLSGSLQLGDPRPAEAGACQILTKPIANKDLVEIISKLAEDGRHGHDKTSPCPAITGAR